MKDNIEPQTHPVRGNKHLDTFAYVYISNFICFKMKIEIGREIVVRHCAKIIYVTVI